MNNIEHLIIARQPVVYASPQPTVVYTSPRPIYQQQPNVVYTTSTNNIGLYILFLVLLIIIIMFFFTPVVYV